MSDAVKYFKKHGLEASKKLIEIGFGFCSLEDGLSFHTDQLKRLVDSHDLVEECGGLDKAKERVTLEEKSPNPNVFYVLVVSSAIDDVESCQ